MSFYLDPSDSWLLKIIATLKGLQLSAYISNEICAPSLYQRGKRLVFNVLLTG
jgi:hypothetical protein